MKRIIYDLEATCWDGQPHADQQEIIEWGAVCIDEYGDIISDFESFVRPQLAPYLSTYCQRLTGIQTQDVLNARPFSEVAEHFRDWLPLGEELIFIAWGKRDEFFLEGDAHLANYDISWMKPQHNLKKAYQRLKALHRPVGLAKALKANNIEPEGIEHRAYWDALNTSQLYLKYMGEWPNIP
jgi:inhibitor of KinA sporulation pathway (predicted exonuclease)